MAGLSTSIIFAVCTLVIFCRREIALFPFTVNKPAWDWSLVAEVVPSVSQDMKLSAQVATHLNSPQNAESLR